MLRRRRRPGGMLVGAASPYTAIPYTGFIAPTFSWLAKSGGLDDGSNSKRVWGNHWFRNDDTAGGSHVIISLSARWVASINGSGLVSLTGLNASAVSIVSITADAGELGDGTWNNLQYYIDTASQATSWITVNGQAQTLIVATFTDAEIHFATTAETRVGHGGGGTSAIVGDLSELWMNIVVPAAPTPESSAAMFLNGNRPGPIGENGEIPTGDAPILYLPSSAVNQGYGGNFTGALEPGQSPVEF